MINDLVCITRYAGYARNSEVKEVYRVPSFFEEGDYETSQTAIHMQTNFVFLSELAKRTDIVHTAIWEVNGRTNNLSEA